METLSFFLREQLANLQGRHYSLHFTNRQSGEHNVNGTNSQVFSSSANEPFFAKINLSEKADESVANDSAFMMGDAQTEADESLVDDSPVMAADVLTEAEIGAAHEVVADGTDAMLDDGSVIDPSLSNTKDIQLSPPSSSDEMVEGES